jgi:hypothetical protein
LPNLLFRLQIKIANKGQTAKTSVSRSCKMGQLNLKETNSLSYKRAEVRRGYTDFSLCINLATSDISIDPIDKAVKEKFIGGKGYDLWMMWNAVSSNTKWDSPENAICISSGPLGGTPGYPGGGKSIVTAISPLTGAPIDSNVGGYFGPYKKFAESTNWSPFCCAAQRLLFCDHQHLQFRSSVAHKF